MKDIQTYLQDNQELMLEVLSNLVSYPSIEGEGDSIHPFGQPVADCLDYALSVCERVGFDRTENLDYYAGFGEIGSGEKVVGIVGHLDVVPVSGDWNSDPFTLTINDGKIYGRGTSDNKGPMVAALFAIKYLIDNKVELKKRIRIVFGCNEESGMLCVKHYVEKEGHFDIGFTPDGPFPCCHGEKGIIGVELTADNKIFKTLKGGVAGNVVPDYCELSIDANLVNQDKLTEYLVNSPLSSHEITIEDGVLTLITRGKAAHASTPELGVNAIGYALTALAVAGVEDDAIKEFACKLNTETDGKSCGVAFVDKYGPLTLNVGTIALDKDEIKMEINIRNPFTRENAEVNEVLTGGGFKTWQVEITGDSKGLYQPEDSAFVKLLTDTYNEVTGKNLKPITMGGGTYARGINNTLAFGPDEPDEEDTHIHDANEFMKLSSLLTSCEIYIKVLLTLIEM